MVLQLLRECLAAAEPDSETISETVLQQLQRALTASPKEIVPGFTVTRYVHDRTASPILLSGEFSFTRSGKSHVGRSRTLRLTMCLHGEWNIYKHKMSVYPTSADIRGDIETGVAHPKGRHEAAYAGFENNLRSSTTAKDVLKQIHTNAAIIHDEWMKRGFR